MLWFEGHQSPEGGWDVDGHPANCSEGGPKCEPGDPRHGWGDRAVTAAVLWSHIPAGMTPSVRRGAAEPLPLAVRHLLDDQAADGGWGDHYADALATASLARILAASEESELRVAVEAGVARLLARQNRRSDGRRVGWNDGAREMGIDDTAATAWAVMALCASREAGVDVGEGLEGARYWLVSTWETANPDRLDHGDSFRAAFPARVHAGDEPACRGDGGSAYAAACAEWLGTDGRLQDSLLADVHARTATDSTTFFIDLERHFFAARALASQRDERSTGWRERIADFLSLNQRLEPACFTGSWDSDGAGARTVEPTGRVLATAFATTILATCRDQMD